MAKTWICLSIVIIISLVSVIPLFHSGFPPTHDGEYHVIRFYEFYNVLAEGNVYPRWAPDLNYTYGVPLFNYVYPLPNYVAAIFHRVGLSFIDSFKANLIAATIVGTIFFFFWARIFWKDMGAVVSTSFYTFAPYRFVDIYVRGSVGEVWALAFFPAFLWGITQFIKERKIEYGILASLALSMVIFSHNILALMFFLFGALYTGVLIISEKKKKQVVIQTGLLFLISLMVSSIFWLPALVETHFVKGLQIYSIQENFAQLYELLIPSWGTGFSQGTLENKMSFQIGVANLLAVFISIIVVFRKKMFRRVVIFFIISFFVIAYLMTPFSFPIWNTVPLMNYFQFPWRFLSLEIIVCAFLAGSFVLIVQKRSVVQIAIGTFLIILVVSLGIGYTQPAYYHQRDDTHYISRPNFLYGTNSPGNEFNTKWGNLFTQKPNQKTIILSGESKIEVVDIKNTRYLFSVDTKKTSKIAVNTSYFPGWEVFINGKKIPSSIEKNGTFAFLSSPGKSKTEIVFNDTIIRSVASFLTLLGIFLLSISYILRKKIQIYENRH